MAICLGQIQVEVPTGDVKVVDRVSVQTTLQQYIQYRTEDSAGRQDIQDAFCVVDLGRLMDVHAQWMAALPNIQPFYAVKCNDDVMVLQTLAALGTGFDCSNRNEMKMVLDLGVTSDRIIYANTVKQVSHIVWAKQNKVDLMTFDSESELRKISEHFPTARLVIRILADSPDALYPLGSKFGCTYTKAEELLQLAKSLELNIVGVSFHVGSLCMNPASYQDAVELAYKVFQYAESVGYHMSLLDIGGGYHGGKDEQYRVLFDKTAKHIQKGLEKFGGVRDLKVIAEPGAFYPTSSYAVAVNIIGKRFVEKTDNGEPLVMYYVNDGTYGSLNCAKYPSYIHLITPSPLKDVSSIKMKLKTTIWGPTCDSGDKIRDCDMPELEIGDWIYFDGIGAYSVSLMTKFNGCELPIPYYYIKESKSDTFSRILIKKTVNESKLPHGHSF